MIGMQQKMVDSSYIYHRWFYHMRDWIWIILARVVWRFHRKKTFTIILCYNNIFKLINYHSGMFLSQFMFSLLRISLYHDHKFINPIFSEIYAHLMRIHRRIRAIRLCSLPTYALTHSSALGYIVQHIFRSRN